MKYHQAAFDLAHESLYGSMHVDSERQNALRNREAEIGITFPSSIHEWYALDLSDEVFNDFCDEGLHLSLAELEGHDGVVQEVHHENGTVDVKITIFGRTTAVNLEFWRLEKL